jgi:hypothetical protein
MGPVAAARYVGIFFKSYQKAVHTSIGHVGGNGTVKGGGFIVIIEPPPFFSFSTKNI